MYGNKNHEHLRPLPYYFVLVCNVRLASIPSANG